MRKALLSLILFRCLLAGTFVYSQKLRKLPLDKTDSAAGVVAKYRYTHMYDGYLSLYLFQDKKYKYDFVSTGTIAYSSGSWVKEESDILLTSAVQKDSVPIKIKLLTSVDSSVRVYRTKFQIPVNLKGQLLSDSRIFVNDTSTYIFPFFDTTFGSFGEIKRIKVDFGNGFISDWVSLSATDFKQLLVVAQMDFVPQSYISLRNKRYKVMKGYILEIGD